MYAVQAVCYRCVQICRKCNTENEIWGKGGLTLEFLCCLDFGFGNAKGVAVVDVEFHFVENVGDDFV